MENCCPKCGAHKSTDSCPKCGLVFSKFNPSLLSEQTSPILQNLWQHLIEHWDDGAAHALFIERAFACRQLGFAAKCYRSKKDDPTALNQTARIQTRMEQTLLAAKTAPPPSPNHAVRYAAALLFILLCLAVAFLSMK